MEDPLYLKYLYIYNACKPEYYHDLPLSPKLSTKPSTQPVVYRALLNTFAKKNKIPIAPPNSGPRVLLIISVIH